jgi:hypothetical protein
MGGIMRSSSPEAPRMVSLSNPSFDAFRTLICSVKWHPMTCSCQHMPGRAAQDPLAADDLWVRAEGDDGGGAARERVQNDGGTSIVLASHQPTSHHTIKSPSPVSLNLASHPL